MDPEKELQRICDQYNGKLTIKDFKVGGAKMGESIYVVKYYLKIPFNDCMIDILYDFGNLVTADFKIDFNDLKNVPKFELTTISHFTKLVLFKKYNWKVQCKDMYLKREIEKLLQRHTLDQLIKNTAFEPTTKGVNSKKTYTIHTVFPLVFEENTSSISAIFEFHKELITIIKERYKQF